MANDKYDVEKMHHDAVAGHGCSIMEAMDGMSLQSQIAAISDLSKTFTKDDGLKTMSSAELGYGYAAQLPRVYLEIKHTGLSGIGKDDLFDETLYVSKRQIEYSCTEQIADGQVHRTVIRDF